MLLSQLCHAAHLLSPAAGGSQCNGPCSMSWKLAKSSRRHKLEEVSNCCTNGCAHLFRNLWAAAEAAAAASGQLAFSICSASTSVAQNQTLLS